MYLQQIIQFVNTTDHIACENNRSYKLWTKQIIHVTHCNHNKSYQLWTHQIIQLVNKTGHTHYVLWSTSNHKNCEHNRSYTLCIVIHNKSYKLCTQQIVWIIQKVHWISIQCIIRNQEKSCRNSWWCLLTNMLGIRLCLNVG